MATNPPLGPSDSSDSGSDVGGVPDTGDPNEPLDSALGEDSQRPITPRESLDPGDDSDSGGTGERRSAANDAGEVPGGDVDADRIVGPEEAGLGGGLDEQEEAQRKPG